MKRLAYGLMAGVLGVTAYASPAVHAARAVDAGDAAQAGAGQGRAGGAGAGGAGAQAVPAKGNGVIFGQVVDGTSGRPIAGATVTLMMRAGGPPRAGGAAPPPPPGAAAAAPGRATLPPGLNFPGAAPGDRVLADGEGRFVFHDLPRGTANLTVTAPGYLDGSSGRTRPNGPSRGLDLGDDERLPDVKLKMWKFAVASGSVVDEAGEPAVGITVRALRRTTTSGRSQYEDSGRANTDDRGAFRISGLVPGDYLIAIPQTQQTVPAAIMDSAIRGVASGAGIGMAMFDLAASGGPAPTGAGVRVGDYILQTTSGASPVPPGPDGRLLSYQTLFYPAAATSSQATPFALGSGEERSGLGFQLRLIPTARVMGTVMGPDGPVANVGVRLMPGGMDDLAADAGFETASAATGADGSFVFLGVPPGQYVARVLKQPRPQIPAELMSSGLMSMVLGPNGGAAPTGTAAMMLFGAAPVATSGADVAGVSIVLNQGIKVAGTILFDGSLPKPTPQQMVQMRINLNPVAGQAVPPSLAGNQPMTSQDGQFKTPGYPAGRYLIQVSGPVPQGWMMRSASVQGRDGTITPIELRDSDIGDLQITFTDKIGQLTGTVRSAGTRTPPTSTVLIIPSDYQTWLANGAPQRLKRENAVAPKTGAYSMSNLLAGDYLIAAVDDRDTTDNQDATFLAAFARVAGHVTIGDGEKKSLDLQVVRIPR